MVFYILKLVLRKHRSCIIAYLISLLFVTFLLQYFGIIFIHFLRQKPQLPPWASMELIQEYENISRSGIRNLISSQSPCVLSLMEPFNPELLHLFNQKITPFQCDTRGPYPIIFESSVEPYPKLIPVMNKSMIHALGITKCCFRRIIGMAPNDEGVYTNYGCANLSLENETRVPVGWEFVTVECNHVAESSNGIQTWDLHTFPYPPKSDNFKPIGNGTKLLNVLMLGLDATSHLNFRRTMPEVHDFLVKNLSALEFMGYHKIGENTYPNIGPLLTNKNIVYYGRGDNEHKLDCEKDFYADDCPFIWKQFKSSGYTTLFAEDTYEMSIFNINRKGFRSPPVDHYFLPFQTVARMEISHFSNGLFHMCFGPRTAFEVLLNYAEKLAISARPRPFFQFVFSGSVTHHYINGPRLIVKHLLKTLSFFQERSVLNNTLLILFSDHGARMDELREHPQGYIEDKLPFLYFVLPEWFQKIYPTAYSNLKDNTRRLITPRDIYKTLLDILPKENGLDLDYPKTLTANESSGPGISLFQQIPVSRTCETAHIPEQFCICNVTLSITTIATDDPMVVEGAHATLNHINKLLSEGDKNEGILCEKLSLGEISRAEQLKTTEALDGYKLLHRLVMRTMPGNATFEARVSHQKSLLGSWKVYVDRVTRLNKYREQSQCIHNANLKPYCYCKI